jgi:Ca2+-binding RTX toxin-like protein
LLLAAVATMVVMAAGIAWALVDVGTNGNDNLPGTANPDQLYGLPGNDRLLSQSSADVDEGGTGDDDVRAGDGNDQINGGPGNDSGTGPVGNSPNLERILAGQNGNDIIDGFTGADNLQGGNDNDQLDGGPQVDTLLGQDGDDFINAVDRAPGDTVSCGSGTDVAVLDATVTNEINRFEFPPGGNKDDAPGALFNPSDCEFRIYVDTLSPDGNVP